MEAAVTKPEAASAGIGMMSESGVQTQEVMAGVFFFPGLFQLLSVHLLLGLKCHVIAPETQCERQLSWRPFRAASGITGQRVLITRHC